MPNLPSIEERIDELVEPVYEPYARIRSLVRPGTSVLDVGCGNGKVGDYLRQAGAFVDGIEPSDSRVEVARSRLRYVSDQWAGPSFADPNIAPEYDLITFLDVLEHIADPAPVLAWAVSRLSANGRICALIPNSAHWSFRLKILRGDWSYEPFGFFDKTHLRFFDPDTMRLLQPPGTAEVSIHFSSFGPWSHPRLVALRPRLFAAHALIQWQRAPTS